MQHHLGVLTQFLLMGSGLNIVMMLASTSSRRYWIVLFFFLNLILIDVLECMFLYLGLNLITVFT
jgi:hypothetical protein